MPEDLSRIADAVAYQTMGGSLRIGKVSALEGGSSRRVRLDITGLAWVAVDADIPGLAVGERVYCMQQGAVVVVSGRLTDAGKTLGERLLNATNHNSNCPHRVIGGAPYVNANMSNGSSYSVFHYLPGGVCLWNARLNFDGGFNAGQRVHIVDNLPTPRLIGTGFGPIVMPGVYLSRPVGVSGSFNTGSIQLSLVYIPWEPLFFIGDPDGAVWSGGINSGDTLSINTSFAV